MRRYLLLTILVLLAGTASSCRKGPDYDVVVVGGGPAGRDPEKGAISLGRCLGISS